MARIVLATIGTWGDVFPAVGLAQGLSGAGHTVRIAAPPSYKDLVEDEGLTFSAIGPPLGFAEYAADPKILSGRLGGFAGFLHLFRRFIFPNLDSYVADLRDAMSGADLMLAHPGLIGAPIAAEVAKVRWGTFSVFPGLIPTAYAPPIPTGLPTLPGAAGRAVHRVGWAAARLNMARLFDPPVNAARQRVGLGPVRNSFFAPVDGDRPYLILASAAVVSRPPDWPPQVQLTGFVTWDRLSSWEEPDGLGDFLDHPEPPILVTLGASSSLDPRSFYQDAVDAIAALGHRALILTGPTPHPIHPARSERVFTAPFVPLSIAAHRCRAAVHHGGVGTTVELLGAGVPQLVVPRGFDQPQTAVRLTQLGVARALPWRKASSRTLRRNIELVIADQRLRTNAVALATKLGADDGTARTVDAINVVLGLRSQINDGKLEQPTDDSHQPPGRPASGGEATGRAVGP